MMKYLHNHNFMPKVEDEVSLDNNVEAEEKIKETHDEIYKDSSNQIIKSNRSVGNEAEVSNLKVEIEDLRVRLNHTENQLMSKEHQLLSANNQISLLEDRLKKYEAFQSDITYLDKIKSEIDELTLEKSKFEAKSKELEVEVQQYRDHVQTLYLILIVLLIIQ